MIKLLVLIVAIAGVVALGLMIDAQSRNFLGAPPPTTHAPLTPIAHGARPSGVVHASGRIEGATPEIELRPQMAGPVAELSVAEGQMVEAGQLLLRLDDAVYVQRINLAAAEVALAEAQLERLLNGAHEQDRRQAAALVQAKEVELKQARLNWNRTNRLRQADVIAQQQADDQTALVESLMAELEAARAKLALLSAPARGDEVRIAQARIASAKAQVELAQAELAKMQLRAPCRGQVLQIDVELGELAGPESLEPALILADTRRFQVRAFVEELDAASVQPGMPAQIFADGMAGRELRGRVVRLSPRMGRKELRSDHPAERFDTKTREVWIELEGAEPLVVGLRVDVIIHLQTAAAPSDGGAGQLAAHPLQRAAARRTE